MFNYSSPLYCWTVGRHSVASIEFEDLTLGAQWREHLPLTIVASYTPTFLGFPHSLEKKDLSSSKFLLATRCSVGNPFAFTFNVFPQCIFFRTRFIPPVINESCVFLLLYSGSSWQARPRKTAPQAGQRQEWQYSDCCCQLCYSK